jgi:hypothetical protein
MNSKAQISFKLDLTQKGPSQLEKIEEKFWTIGFEKENNLCYYNFPKFEPKFELKFREDKSC